MRLALAIVALACAGSAAAEPVQDRYGPPRKAASASAATSTMQLRPYEGRLLGWAGKASATPPASTPAPVQLASAPQPRPQVQPQPAIVRAPAQALPQSLYDSPRPAPAPAPAAVREPEPQPAPAPRLAQAPAAPQRGAAPARLYSLHREYGMTPDAVPAAPSGTGYVLIGPAEADEGAAPARTSSIDSRLF